MTKETEKKTRILKPQLVEKVMELSKDKKISFTVAELDDCYKTFAQKDRNFNTKFLNLILNSK